MANRRPDDSDEANRGTPPVDREAVGDAYGGTGQEDSLAPYSGVGTDLKSARERAGLTIADVAQRLRIRERQLRAIEDGTFEEVPGQIYARGFIRNYAELMGLNGETLVERFKEETGHVVAPTKLEFPTPTPESRMPRMGLVLLAILIAAAAYAGWFYMNDIRDLANELVSEVPGRLDEGTVGLGTQPSGEEPARPDDTSKNGLGGQDGLSPKTAPADAEPAATTAPANVSPTTQPEPESSDMANRENAGSESTVTETAPRGSNEAIATDPTVPAESPTETAAASQPDDSTTVSGASPTEGETTGMPVGNSNGPDQQTAAPAASPLTETTPAPAPTPAPTMPVNGNATQPVETEPPAGQRSTSIATPPPPAIPSTGTENGEYVPQVFGIGNTDARVALRARFDCWVQVLGPDGEQLLTRILRAGDVYLAPNRRDLKLFASDAGALEVVVDGKSIPPIGASGEVLRNVSLDAAALLEGKVRGGG